MRKYSLFDYHRQLLHWTNENNREIFFDDDTPSQEWLDYDRGLCDYITSIIVEDNKEIQVGVYCTERHYYPVIEEKIKSLGKLCKVYHDWDERFKSFLIGKGWTIVEETRDFYCMEKK